MIVSVHKELGGSFEDSVAAHIDSRRENCGFARERARVYVHVDMENWREIAVIMRVMEIAREIIVHVFVWRETSRA